MLKGRQWNGDGYSNFLEILNTFPDGSGIPLGFFFFFRCVCFDFCGWHIEELWRGIWGRAGTGQWGNEWI